MNKTKTILTIGLWTALLSSSAFAYNSTVNTTNIKPVSSMTQEYKSNVSNMKMEMKEMKWEMKENKGKMQGFQWEFSEIFKVIDFDKLDESTKLKVKELFSKITPTMVELEKSYMAEVSKGKMESNSTTPFDFKALSLKYVEKKTYVINTLFDSLKSTLPSTTDTTSLDEIKTKIIEKMTSNMLNVRVENQMIRDKMEDKRNEIRETRELSNSEKIKSLGDKIFKPINGENSKPMVKITEKLKLQVDKLMETKTDEEKIKIITTLNGKIDTILNSGKVIPLKTKETLIGLQNYLNSLLPNNDNEVNLDTLLRE